MDLQNQIKLLPDNPGVYIMKDNNKQVIYVGKAISLKNRVRQYFQSSKNHSPKVKAMVSNISEFEYIITDSEMEALILECNLIKEYKPKYNILLRDDKTYPYIKITYYEDYPRVLKTRKLLKDKSKYFGPYTNVLALNETLDTIKEMYPLRTCKIDIIKAIEKNQRPCLNHHIKRCIAPCRGYISKEEYLKIIHEIDMIFSGRADILIDKLKKDMSDFSSKLDFEMACKCRDKIFSLEDILQKQKISSSNNAKDQDVIAIAKMYDRACVQIFFIRDGKVIGREHYIFNDIFETDNNEILSSFIKQFYTNADFIAKEIILEENIEDMDIIEDWLTHRKNEKVAIKVPQKGDKKDLIQMVKKNAFESLEKFKNIENLKHNKSENILLQLKNLLNLKEKPTRIEAFDISNIQGVDSVGSMVVFTDGKKDKKEYRRYKLDFNIPNDYKCMMDIIYRRFQRDNYPNLILVDGSIGHVNVVNKVLGDLNIQIPIWGMYKDDKHKTKGLISNDNDIELDKTTDIYRFIASVQEEVHRFAISYHKSLRDKRITKSILDDINGIGSKRKMALLSNFKDIENIKKASIEELAKVDTMNLVLAKKVYDFFRKKD